MAKSFQFFLWKIFSISRITYQNYLSLGKQSRKKLIYRCWFPKSYPVIKYLLEVNNKDTWSIFINIFLLSLSLTFNSPSDHLPVQIQQ